MHRPRRASYYWRLTQTQIARHLKRRHEDKDLNRSALNVSKVRHDKIIYYVCKLGIIISITKSNFVNKTYV